MIGRLVLFSEPNCTRVKYLSDHAYVLTILEIYITR